MVSLGDEGIILHNGKPFGSLPKLVRIALSGRD
jgi:hypothetical protein